MTLSPEMLSPEMRVKLTDRLAALGAHALPVSLVGTDLRCETVEDAERLVARFETWLSVFAELADEAGTINEDRALLTDLYNTLDKYVRLEVEAIRATRERGVPWEQTIAMTSEPAKVVKITACQLTQEYRIIERFDEGCPEPFGFEFIAVEPDVGCILMLHWLDGREAYRVQVEEVRGTTLHVRKLP